MPNIHPNNTQSQTLSPLSFALYWLLESHRSTHQFLLPQHSPVMLPNVCSQYQQNIVFIKIFMNSFTFLDLNYLCGCYYLLITFYCVATVLIARSPPVLVGLVSFIISLYISFSNKASYTSFLFVANTQLQSFIHFLHSS